MPQIANQAGNSASLTLDTHLESNMLRIARLSPPILLSGDILEYQRKAYCHMQEIRACIVVGG